MEDKEKNVETKLSDENLEEVSGGRGEPSTFGRVPHEPVKATEGQARFF